MGETLLVRGRWVVTGGEADPVIEDGAVLVEGDRIREVGEGRALAERFPDARRLGSERTAVLPGLINAHHHSHGTSSVQGGLADDLLEPWILGFARLRGGDIYLNTLLSAARMLRTGVTTVVDVHSNTADAKGYEEGMRRGLRAYDEAGLRVAFAAGFRTQSLIVHGKGEDERFLASLPAAVRAQAERLLPPADRIGEDDYLDLIEALAGELRSHPRIDVWFAPPGPQWVSDRLMQRIAERAEAIDTGIQTHVDESIYEMLHGPKFYGRPTVLHLQALGVLTPRFSMAHGVWLKEPEIEALAESGAAVSHNPSSNLRLRAGIAPLNALREAGVTVGLGMDGTTLDDDEDMFTEMRLAMRLHRTPLLRSPAPRPRDVFALATSGGARLLRKEALLGRLAPGFAADLVVVDLERATWPWIAPEADPLELVLMRASAGDVREVVVAGELALENGVPTGFDVEAAGRELAARLASAPAPEDGAALVEALTPHLEAWYAGWEIPALEPYIRYNSRS